MVVLRGKRVLLRPGRPEDADTLVRIRKEPEVARRWGDSDIEEEIVEQFVGADEGFVVEVAGMVVGAIQYGEEDDPMYRHANVDIFLTTARHGQGLATEAIRLLATSSRNGATIVSRSSRRPTTQPRSAPTRWRASARSGSCEITSAAPTVFGTTDS